MLVSLHMKVRLGDKRDTKKVLYQNDNYLFREPYEISTDPLEVLFDEQSPALERMSRDFASRRVVSDILENTDACRFARAPPSLVI